MKYIISGTNRPGSRTLQVAKLVQKIYSDLDESVGLIDLATLPWQEISGKNYGGNSLPQAMVEAIETVNAADGLIVITPEYNGSMPGALKYFIDFWKYPDSFEARPVCFIGLGGTFGGLRPVEHLQGIFGYRNAFMFPERVFLFNIWNTLKDGQLTDTIAKDLLNKQAVGFIRFVRALQSEKLDANSRK